MGCNYTPLRWAGHGKAAHLPGRDHFGLPYRFSSVQTWGNTQKSCGYIHKPIVTARCDTTLSLLPFNAAVSDDLLVPASMPFLPFSNVLSILASTTGAILLGALRVVEPHARRRRWGGCFNFGVCSGNWASGAFLWWPLPVGTSLFSLPFGLILLLGSLRLFALLLSVLLVRIFILGLDPFQMSLSVMNCHLIDTRAWKQQIVCEDSS